MPAEWIEYIPGSLPIILTSPHNGPLRPEEVPKRQHGCWSKKHSKCIWKHGCKRPNATACHAETIADLNSLAIMRRMADLLEKKTGAKPYLVVNKLHRSLLDANRLREEATDGLPMMEAAYDTFFSKGRAAHDAVQEKCGRGILIDVHGHAQNRFVMLGYDFPEERFEFSDKELDSKSKYRKDSTIRALAWKNSQGLSFSRLLRGAESYGTLLWDEGVEAVPSTAEPEPDEIKGKYLDGAVIVNRFGSQYRGSVDAIQMEIPSKWRNGEGDVKAKTVNREFAKKAVNALLKFMDKAYGWNEGELSKVCSK